ncbi:hypothetical protein GRF29_185g297041 [Pseudopithomyces chartarum]|uniref:MTC6 partial TIM-barrel domain-containing protein n=1 Tax=Pseudopithomyces chartarum TaxID=1892770 RepID=A0AAN6LR72_9PLEO|nr:hypothetical protein GRF29_185g297041 [Pseudopithomyces chartarum]
MTLGYLTDIFNDFLEATATTTDASFTHLLLNIHAASSWKAPNEPARQPPADRLPGPVGTLLSSILTGNLSDEIYTPQKLADQRANLRKSWNNVDIDNHVQPGYYAVETSPTAQSSRPLAGPQKPTSSSANSTASSPSSDPSTPRCPLTISPPRHLPSFPRHALPPIKHLVFPKRNPHPGLSLRALHPLPHTPHEHLLRLRSPPFLPIPPFYPQPISSHPRSRKPHLLRDIPAPQSHPRVLHRGQESPPLRRLRPRHAVVLGPGGAAQCDGPGGLGRDGESVCGGLRAGCASRAVARCRLRG